MPSNPVTLGNTGLLTAASTSVALTTSGSAPSNSRIIILVPYYSSTSSVTISSVSDPTNGSYFIDSQGVNIVNTLALGLAICSVDAPGGLATSSIITVNFSASLALRGIIAYYSTGIQTGSGAAYGAVSQNQNANTAWSSTTTTVTSNDLLFGGSHWEDSVTVTDTISGGNTELDDITIAGAACVACYQIGTGAAIAASGTWSTISNSSSGPGCRSVAVAYKAGGAPVTPAFTPRRMPLGV